MIDTNELLPRNPLSDLQYAKPDPEYAKFISIDYSDTTIKLALIMDRDAPKTCECGKRMSAMELAYRFHVNLAPFLCYKCIQKYKALGAEILPSVEPGYPREIKCP